MTFRRFGRGFTIGSDLQLVHDSKFDDVTHNYADVEDVSTSRQLPHKPNKHDDSSLKPHCDANNHDETTAVYCSHLTLYPRESVALAWRKSAGFKSSIGPPWRVDTTCDINTSLQAASQALLPFVI